MDKKISPHVFYEYLNFDGISLFTVICLPQKTGKFPTVIFRTPYVDAAETLDEEEICKNILEGSDDWFNNGYALVLQHCRGRGKSSGDCIPFIHERDDGLFLQNWIRNQPFYNGELYLYGLSYTSSVHFVTAPFADDIKGAVLQVQDCERYNSIYRNGFFKSNLHGSWYVEMYKRKSIPTKNFTPESYNMLPLSNFSRTVLGENSIDFDETLKHPDKNDVFWKTHLGGGESHNAIMHANIPILLITGFYDIYTGGIFNMWNSLDDSTKSMSALAVHPYDHSGSDNNQPILFDDGHISKKYGNFTVKWFNFIKNKCDPPFKTGKVTYYKLFDNKWCCDCFLPAKNYKKIELGNGVSEYEYNPDNPATFKGGLSTNFGGCDWQDAPNSRDDIITLHTPEFTKDTFIKGKIKAKLTVKSDCEDTCFYMRLSLCKKEGDYGLRDDINQISNFCDNYIPNTQIEMDFSFDEHAFVAKKGEKIRIDISSSAFPFFVRHTNNKGLFSEQTTSKIAKNAVILDSSYIEIPID